METRGGGCKELCGDGVGAFSERKNAQGIRTSKDLKKDCKGERRAKQVGRTVKVQTTVCSLYVGLQVTLASPR